MLNDPLLNLLLTTLVTTALAWLINQLPSVNQLPGKDALSLKLTVELMVLLVILSWLKDVSQTSEQLNAVKTVGIIFLLLFSAHTFQLVAMLWQSRRQSRCTGIPNPPPITILQQSPYNWRQELLGVMQTDVMVRLDDSLHNQELIQLLMEDWRDQVGRPQLMTVKINEFLQASSRLSPIVVCCREEEYIKGRAILGLRGAVCLQPLEPEQIKAYLRQVECSHLWKPIEDDLDGLRELAKMPLLLNLIPVAYPQGLRRPRKHSSDPEERQNYQRKCRQDLFDAYIKRRLERPHNRQRYKAEETERWLIWLAKTLKEQKQTKFLIEKMQLNYLKTPRQNLLYVLIFVLIAMLVTGLLTVPVIGLVPGLFMGFCFGMIVGLSKEIKTVESFRFSFKNKDIYVVAVFSLLFFWLFLRLNIDLFGVLIAELSVMLIRDEIQNRDKPNQGIWESVKNTVIISSIIFLVHVLFLYSLPSLATGRTINLIDVLTSGLRSGLLFGICFSGLPCIQHFVLRLILWWSGSVPWNYARFLRYAADRRFIQQIGGRYRFIHDLLREHFSNKQDYFINK